MFLVSRNVHDLLRCRLHLNDDYVFQRTELISNALFLCVGTIMLRFLVLLNWLWSTGYDSACVSFTKYMYLNITKTEEEHTLSLGSCVELTVDSSGNLLSV